MRARTIVYIDGFNFYYRWIVTGNQHPSQVLAKIAQFRKPVRNSALANSQLPAVIPGTTIRKPSNW